MKKIAILQPLFLPWLGFFEHLDHVDFCVVLDNVQYCRGTFMGRNRLLSTDGRARWFSQNLPKKPLCTQMNEIAPKKDFWWHPLFLRFAEAYKKTPHWSWVESWFKKEIPPGEKEHLAAYNWRLILSLCQKIQIPMEGKWLYASSLPIGSSFLSPQNRVLRICDVLGATDYCNPSRGIEEGLYCAKEFKKEGIVLWKQDYRHPSYFQVPRGEFCSHLSILDLLCHVGQKDALEIIQKGKKWEQWK